MFVYSLRIIFFLSRIYASKVRRVAVATTITADIAVLTVSKNPARAAVSPPITANSMI